MERRTLINVLAGVGALGALFFSMRASANVMDTELYYSGDIDMGATNYKVNEYPKYATAIREAETRYGIPTDLLARLLYQESRYRPDVISGAQRSSVGATGIAQFMPRTGEEYGLVTYEGNVIISDRRLDPFASIDAAGRYLRMLYRMFNNWQDALMAYNWGPGNVAKYNRGEPVTVPIETSQYVAQITADVYVA